MRHGLKRSKEKRLTLEQKAKIRKVCEAKLQEYIEKRGLSIWDYRLFDKEPIPDSLYYKVMKDGKQRCALCGARLMSKISPLRHFSFSPYIETYFIFPDATAT